MVMNIRLIKGTLCGKKVAHTCHYSPYTFINPKKKEEDKKHPSLPPPKTPLLFLNQGRREKTSVPTIW